MRLSARGAQERERAADLAHRVTAAAHAVTRAETARAHSASIAAELAYRHASLALAAAEKSAAAQKRELADARTLYSAWQAAESVLRHRAAADRVARVSAAIQEAERDAAPALAARAKAAVDLVRALHAAAQNAENLANEEEERSAALQEVGDGAYRDSTAAATEAQRARSEIGHLRQRLAEVEQETAEAVRAGWLDDSAPDADPARAALAASDAEKTTVAAWDTARETARRATEHAREAAAAESRAELTAARAADAATAAERAHEGERRTAESLAAEQRLAELLGLPGASGKRRTAVPGQRTDSGGATDGPREGGLTAEELDRYADELRELLDDAVSSAERQLFELRTAAADDARILGALGDGGLLPPGPDVLATVEFLGEHGIPALPGWRYLAQAVDPADHARVLAARPELVDGVVITDPDSHVRAREALSGAALLPRSAVAVGTAAALLAPTPASDSGDVFLVPPNPAMHDEHAADEERQALRARATERDEEIRALAARLGKDRELAARLASWRTGCPAGRLAELAATAEQARAFAEEAEAELAEARSLRAEAEEAAAEAVRVRDERQEAAQRARRAADALAGLAFRLRERAGWQAKLRELADDAAEAEARAQSCLERARAADEDRRAAQRAADDARRTARTLRAERSEIAGAPDDLPEDGDGAPQASLPALREAYRAASQVYEKVGVGADLRAEQARAESDESATRAELDRLSNKVRTRAEQLLQSPDGSDGPSRQAAAARAEELVQLLETRMSGASEQLGRLRGEAERLAPADGEAHTDLPEELVPRDAEHAQALLRTATGELATREEELAQARRRTPSCSPRTGPPRTRPAASTRSPPCSATCCASTPRRRSRSGPNRTRETWTTPGGPPPRRAARCAAAPPTCPPPRPPYARRATCWCGTPTPPATSRCARLPASRSVNCPPPRCRSTPRSGPTPSRPGCGSSRTSWSSWSATATRSWTGCAAWSSPPSPPCAPPSGCPGCRRAWGVVRAGVPAHPLRGARPGHAHRAARRGHRRGHPRGRQEELRPAARRHVPAAARRRRRPEAQGRGGRDPQAGRGAARRAGAGRADGRRVLRRAAAHRGHRPVLHDGRAALQRPGPRQAPARRHAVPRQPHRPGQRDLSAGAPAGGRRRARRPAAVHHGPVRHHGPGRVPLVIRLRNDADLRAGLKYISVEEHLRPGLPQPDPGEETHSEITATRMFKRPAATS